MSQNFTLSFSDGVLVFGRPDDQFARKPQASFTPVVPEPEDTGTEETGTEETGTEETGTEETGTEETGTEETGTEETPAAEEQPKKAGRLKPAAK